MASSLIDNELNAHLRLVLKSFYGNENALRDFSKRIQAELTYHSTAIEGSTLSLAEAIEAIEGRPISTMPEVHCKMVSDHHKALLFVMEHSFPAPRLTTDFIKRIGAMVMQTTGSAHHTALGGYDESAGDLRLNNVHADGQYFLSYAKVPQALANFVNELEEDLKYEPSRKDLHPTSLLQIAWNAHYQLVKIHPFGDGNGRTARLIMNYILSRMGLPPCIVFIEDRDQYIGVLRLSHGHTEMTPEFREFMYQQYFKTLGYRGAGSEN